MKKNNLTSIFTGLVLAVLIFASCETTKERQTLSDAFSRYLTASEATIAFGKVDFIQLMEKSDLKESALFGKLVSEELSEIEKAIDLKEQLFFALDGPFYNYFTSNRFVLFLAVKDKESLQKYLKKAGYLVKETDSGLSFVEEMGVAIGFDDNLLLVFNDNQSDEIINELESTFKLVLSPKSPIADKYQLAGNEDFFIASNLEYLYSTSNTDLNQLPEQAQEKLNELTDGSFIKMSLTFGDGEILIAADYLFNDALKEWMFFNREVDADWIGKQNVQVADSEPWMIGNIQLDLNRLNAMMKDLNMDLFDELIRELGTASLFVKGIAKNGLSDLVNGQIGWSAYNSEAFINNGNIEDMNVYLGVGAVYDELKELLDVLVEDGFMQQTNGAFVLEDNTNIQFQDKDIIVEQRSGKDWNVNDVPLRTEAVTLGVHPIEIFMDVQSAAIANSDVDEITSIFTNAIDYVYMHGGNEHLHISINLMDKNQNALKYLFKSGQQQMEMLSLDF